VKESGRYIKKCQQRREREKEREKEWMALYMCFVSFCAFLLGCVKWLGICLVSVTLGSVCFDWFLSRVVTCQLSVVSCQLCILLCFYDLLPWPWSDKLVMWPTVQRECMSVGECRSQICFCLFHPLVCNSMLVSALFIDTV
jgi:hypothetical protein